MSGYKLKPLTAGWLIAAIYFVGLVGFILPQTKPLMQKLVWVNLLLTLIVLLAFHKKWSKEFIFSALLIAMIGFLIEVIGVKTGYIFGYYQYGPSLGFSFWDTPLIMMANWLTTVYITRQVAEMIAKDAFLVSVLSAFFMVLLDYFLEPFAIQNYLWQWNSGNVPIHNYIGWFISGILIQYLFQKSVKFPPNKLSLPLYIIQLSFFIVLYFLG